jgi:hypothetical protein
MMMIMMMVMMMVVVLVVVVVVVMIASFVDTALTLVHLDKGPGFLKFDCFLLGSSEKQNDLEEEKKEKNKAKEKIEETEDVSKEEVEKEQKNKEMKADTHPIDDDISSSDSQVIPKIL